MKRLVVMDVQGWMNRNGGEPPGQAATTFPGTCTYLPHILEKEPGQEAGPRAKRRSSAAVKRQEQP